MFSWQAYRRNVPRFGGVRLVFFAAVALLFLVLPLLEGLRFWPASAGVLVGLTPLGARAPIAAQPGRSGSVLRVLGIGIMVFTIATTWLRLGPLGVGLVSACATGWASLWFVLMSDDRVEVG